MRKEFQGITDRPRLPEAAEAKTRCDAHSSAPTPVLLWHTATASYHAWGCWVPGPPHRLPGLPWCQRLEDA